MRLKLYDYPARDAPDDEVIVIHHGLSVIVRGHKVYIERDDARKTARICVKMIAGHVTDGLEQADIEMAADMLCQRARRFLGYTWTVAPWVPLDGGTAQNAG